jgi:hypothetical protein
MRKVEAKAAVVSGVFPKAAGWRLTVNIDSSERSQGEGPPEQGEAAVLAEAQLRHLGATIGPHPRFGAKDIVAEHDVLGTLVIKVLGDSGRPDSESLYSAIGQLILLMDGSDSSVSFVIAAPNSEKWIRQLRKIPGAVRDKINLKIWLVGTSGAKVDLETL